MAIAGEFRRRAFHEARRYGGDAWVFVRELLQNARDAGAHRVDITVDRRDGADRIVCRDDGCGMSFEHARKYLFTLYASSKQKQNDAAGRFGIGFWSVLRFDPDEVFVRSSARGEPGWELRLSGDLETIERSETTLETGTEIELVRRTREVDVVREVWDAIQRDARHLRRRDSEIILDVRVNSKEATAEIELEPPTLGFSRSGLRGAVALADRPRVDLLAHGLRVRTAATLDELLAGPDRRRRRRSITPEGLVPRVILDSRRLRVLMARGDARTDGELRRLVATGRRAVRRLVRGQLDREAGLGFAGRFFMRLREPFSTRWVRKAAIALGLVAVLAVSARWLTGMLADRAVGPNGFGPGLGTETRGRPDAVLEVDSAGRYRGPAANLRDLDPARLSLRYTPVQAAPLLAVFRVTSLADDGRVTPGPVSSGPRPYLGSACGDSCLAFDLELGGLQGDIRLPVPTGHLLDPSSLEIVGGAAVLWAAPDGGPVLVVEDPPESIRYRTGLAVEIQTVAGGSWPDLPAPVIAFAAGLRGLEPDEVAASARDWVRRRVVYDTSARTLERHRVASLEGVGFAQRCLAVGAGDCDVQNALLAALIAQAGVPARMAVGFVGREGRAVPGLHAWAEYRNGSGLWRAIDASRGGPTMPVVEVPSEERRGSESEIEVEPSTVVGVEPSPAPGPSIPTLAATATLIGFAIIGIVLTARRRLVVHRVRSTDVPDLAGLLRGALARPEAYREVPALFSREVVPSIGGSSISLDRARLLASRRRLAFSADSSGLARRVAATGLPVIDGNRPEGLAVAAVLGAIDLDRWDETIHRGREHPMTRGLTEAAAEVGEVWMIIVVSGLSQEIAVLDGALTGAGRNNRVIAVDEGGELWRRVIELGDTQRGSAILLMADRVTHRVRMPKAAKRRLLSRLAVEAVLEKAEPRP